MLSRVPTGYPICMQVPVSYQYPFKILFLSFLSKRYLLCICFHFKPTPSFSFKFLFSGSGTRTHTHTHTTPTRLKNTGRQLGREHNHPTVPLGHMARYLSHPIIPSGNRSGIDTIQPDHIGYRSGNQPSRATHPPPNRPQSEIHTHTESVACRPHTEITNQSNLTR